LAQGIWNIEATIAYLDFQPRQHHGGSNLQGTFDFRSYCFYLRGWQRQPIKLPLLTSIGFVKAKMSK
jgi:hypothetical protein